MEVRRGVPTGFEDEVAALYWEAFGRKLGPALGPDDAGRAFLARHLNHDRGIVVLGDGGSGGNGSEVLGVAGYQLGGRALLGGSAGDVLAQYGRVRGLPRLALLALLERTAAPGELVMDGICVAARARSRGLGVRLLDEVAAVATEHGCRRIRLDVIDTNPRARTLYERNGFTAVRTQRTPYLRAMMGFGAVTTMHRAMGAPTERRGA